MVLGHPSLEGILAKARSDERMYTLQFSREIFGDLAMRMLLDLFQSTPYRSWKEFRFDRQCRGTMLETILAATLNDNNVQLERLAISDCEDFCSGHHHHPLAPFYRSLSRNRGLKSLHIEEVSPQWSDAMAKSLAASLGGNERTTLQEFHIKRGRFLQIDSLRLLGMALPRTLTVANFDQLELNDDQVSALVTTLQHHPSLKSLSLAKNNCGPQGITALALMLQTIDLEDLDLSGQTGNEPETETETLDMAILGRALRNNTTLKKLRLGDNSLNDRSIQGFVEPVLLQSNVQELYLRGNRISDDGIQHIAQHLRQNTNLKRITLQGNRFGETGARALLEALRYNMELEFLSLPGELQCGKQIFHLLQLNKGGRRLLGADNAPLELWPLIFERALRLNFWTPGRLNDACRVNVLFWLLQDSAGLERCG
jgi:hypothetical protein